MPRKVLQLRGSSALFGAESVVIELARHSSAFGFESIIGAPTPPGAAEPELLESARACGIRTQSFNCAGRLDLRFARELRSFVRRESIDLVHCHGYKEDFYALLARLGVPLIATNHNWLRHTRLLALYARLDAFLLRYFDRVVAVSDALLEEMLDAGVHRQRVEKIDNGVDLSRFSDKQAPPLERPALGLRDDAIVLATVSRLGEEKGHRHALEALASLVKHQPRTQLLIVGDGPERAALQTQAQQRGLTEHVVFAGRRRDIPRLLKSIDIFLLPSLREGLPMALLEAMAAGKAVVASDVGAVGDAVEEGVSGILVRPADPGGLAGALQPLIDEPQLRRRLGDAAAQRIRARFSSQAMTRSYCHIYEDELAAVAGLKTER